MFIRYIGYILRILLLESSFCLFEDPRHTKDVIPEQLAGWNHLDEGCGFRVLGRHLSRRSMPEMPPTAMGTAGKMGVSDSGAVIFFPKQSGNTRSYYRTCWENSKP